MDQWPGGPPNGYPPPPPPYGDPLIGGDLGGWWARAMRIVSAGWRPLFLVQLIGLVPQALFVTPVLFLAAGSADDLDPRAETIDAATLATLGGYTLLVIAVFVGVQAVTTVGAIHVAASVAFGRPARVGAAVGYALRRALPLLGWQFLGGLLALLALCACVVPVLYVLTVLSILPAVVAFERGGALVRCFRLFHHRTDVAASRLIIAGLVGVGFAMAGEALSRFGDGLGLLGSMVEVPGLAGGAITAGLVSAVGGVLTAPLLLTAYADIRAHAEPLTSSTLAVELGL
ncbi:hypothetical protein Val02_07650 [Virgisporangium aliadipatigenens]|uniref:Uncharacterized protein n=1 Tax=Virgisporangium aliadipatigenens TaxID=741659 RepID=A0A8J3YEX2_9ACTN|nr:hypothetical protein [Virgisporangium aliadipatigenens]GIJ43879.1 hypothetical protein Val02_07650 [Virgisporangium aliadipatigenens]